MTALRRPVVGACLAFPIAASAAYPALSPSGPVAAAQRTLILDALGLMAIVVVPVFVLAGVFVWRYRASNEASRYAPDWDFSLPLDIVIWVVPALVVVAISVLQWRHTHALDPYRPLSGNGPPLEVQAIALDWKWLFLYPEQDLATVDELVVPRGRPVTVALTSDTVMNAFFVPGLAGQIYAMAGMRTELNLRADVAGPMWGRNTQFSGAGFPHQEFAVSVVEPEAFERWQTEVRAAGGPLDDAAYAAIAAPDENGKNGEGERVGPSYATRYAGGTTQWFDRVVAKYAPGREPMRSSAAKPTR